MSGRRRRARLPSRWPPSAAQTERAVFPHSAFTKTPSRGCARSLWHAQVTGRATPLAAATPTGPAEGWTRVTREWPSHAAVRLSQLARLLERGCTGISQKELIHLPALTQRARLLSRPPSPAAFPDPLRSPLLRSRGFHHACGTTRPSDDSPGTASHFACAYRVASLGATREPDESSWGHVMVFCTVPSANTLIRWVDERRLRPHSAGSTWPHLRPTGSSWGGPHRLRPGTSPHALRIPPRGGHPALRVTRGGSRSPLAVSGFRLRARVGFSIPASPRPARNYPRLRIRRPSSGRRRDLNPPDHHAAQRTLCNRPTSQPRASWAYGLRPSPGDPPKGWVRLGSPGSRARSFHACAGSSTARGPRSACP